MRNENRESHHKNGLPVSKPWLVRGFTWYARNWMRKSFHVLAVDASQLENHFVASDRPLVVCANHPGWWDPIVAFILKDVFFPDRTLYAPIDAIAIEKYRVFRQLGFYGVHHGSSSGVSLFLQTSRCILNDPKSSLWITPEGKFSDPRDATSALMPGIAHLLAKTSDVSVVTLAIEYPFVEERLPEALCRFSQPIRVPEGDRWSKSEWNQKIFESLRDNQKVLAESIIQRTTDNFQVLFSSTTSTRTWYDFFRKWSSKLAGRQFDARHGTRFK